MIRPRKALMACSTAVAIAWVVAGCAKQQAAETSRIEDKTFAMKPAAVSVEAGVLAGQLSGLVVVERVNAGTNEVVSAPQMHGNLKLKNTASDQAVQVVGGRIQYLDAQGKKIPLSEDRTDTTFTLTGYGQDRLDPGKEVSQDLDVPFPARALKGGTLANVQINITYLPTPYRTQSVSLPVQVVSQK